MKRFRVCYILEDKVRTENILKEMNINTGQLFDELVNKVAAAKYIKIRTDRGPDRIDTSHIRYIRVSPLNDR